MIVHEQNRPSSGKDSAPPYVCRPEIGASRSGLWFTQGVKRPGREAVAEVKSLHGMVQS
jgi:hypothetical protein